MSTVEPNLAGPRRPQDRVAVRDLRRASDEYITLDGKADQLDAAFPLEGGTGSLHHGAVVIAAITSCTNTSNPAVMIGAGLVAQKALARGLQRKPWVKSSLAPGSKVVTDYLTRAGLQAALDALGFNLVGYGCTTCIGNSGPLPAAVEKAITDNDLVACAVLSGNRNFEGRIHPLVKANWLASPPLVVAYALAGTTRIDLSREPLGEDSTGQPVYLRDIWPSNAEIAALVNTLDRDMFKKQYSRVFDGDRSWQSIETGGGATYAFAPDSTYIQLPPFFEVQYQGNRQNILAAPMLAMLGDSVTTDHISPAGAIPADSPAAQYLREQGVTQEDFNSYGSRRGNHQVMMRGTFGNIRIRNEMTPTLEGGYTRLNGQSQPMFIYDAAMEYQSRGIRHRGGRRTGVRHRLQSRLGSQGHAVAGREGGHRRKLRTHPPLQPRRHGRSPTAIHAGRNAQDAGAAGRRDLRHSRSGRRTATAAESACSRALPVRRAS